MIPHKYVAKRPPPPHISLLLTPPPYLRQYGCASTIMPTKHGLPVKKCVSGFGVCNVQFVFWSRHKRSPEHALRAAARIPPARSACSGARLGSKREGHGDFKALPQCFPQVHPVPIHDPCSTDLVVVREERRFIGESHD